jgi:hypothetical protein
MLSIYSYTEYEIYYFVHSKQLKLSLNYLQITYATKKPLKLSQVTRNK